MVPVGGDEGDRGAEPPAGKLEDQQDDASSAAQKEGRAEPPEAGAKPPSGGGVNQPPNGAQIAPDAPGERQGDDGPTERRFWNDLNVREWISASAAVVAAVAALAGVSVAYCSYQASDRQLAVMRRQLSDAEAAASGAATDATAAATREDKLISANESLASAASGQADSTKSLASTASDQLDATKRNLRAYLTMTSIVPVGFGPDNKPSTWVRYKNYGHTSAHDISVDLGTDIFPSDIGEQPSPRFIENNALKGGELAPDEESIVNSPINPKLRAGDIAEISRGEDKYFMFGTVSYADVFGDRHHTVFCVTYGPGKVPSTMCKGHNYSD